MKLEDRKSVSGYTFSISLFSFQIHIKSELRNITVVHCFAMATATTNCWQKASLSFQSVSGMILQAFLIVQCDSEFFSKISNTTVVISFVTGYSCKKSAPMSRHTSSKNAIQCKGNVYNFQGRNFERLPFSLLLRGVRKQSTQVCIPV